MKFIAQDCITHTKMYKDSQISWAETTS